MGQPGRTDAGMQAGRVAVMGHGGAITAHRVQLCAFLAPACWAGRQPKAERQMHSACPQISRHTPTLVPQHSSPQPHPAALQAHDLLGQSFAANVIALAWAFLILIMVTVSELQAGTPSPAGSWTGRVNLRQGRCPWGDSAPFAT